MNVPPDLVTNVLDPATTTLRPRYAAEGVRLARVMQPSLAYCYFNMDDPVVGGYTPDKIALRRAILMAYNTSDLINVWYQGQAVRATQPIPPPVRGHSPGFDVNIKYDPATAKALLDRFGYVDQDGDGWRDLPDGKPLVLSMGSQPSGRNRELDELWTKSMKAIGIRIDFVKQKWPDLLKMGRAAKLQMWPVGWITTYGEGDAFMQLLYSPNIGQSNYARFVNAGVRRAVPAVEAHPRRPGARCALSQDGGDPRRVQPVGSGRVPLREHARAAVDARVQEARLLRARVEVLRHRPHGK